MSEPLVSILIPTYNAAPFVAAAIESALAQTYRNTEVVVVDDGSSDGTPDVVAPFEARGVRVERQARNRGQTATLNRCLEQASGQFIQYLDADDLISPEKIEIQVERLLREPPRTLATCSWARFYGDDPSKAVFRRGPDYVDYDDPIEWLLADWSGHGTMPPGAWLYPRSIVDEIGPWNEALSLNNDMEYFTRAVLASERIAFCPAARLYYRSGNVSLSGRTDERALRSQHEVIRLSTERMLAHENSARTRRACAGFWQTLGYMAYPHVPELVEESERQVQRLGGGDRKVPVSRPLRPVRDLLGWKPALRLHQIYYKLRYGQ